MLRVSLLSTFGSRPRLRTLLAAGLLVAPSLHAQGSAPRLGPTQAQLLAAKADTANWLYATHDYSGARYVNVKQITPANASRLAPVCAFQVGDVSTTITNKLLRLNNCWRISILNCYNGTGICSVKCKSITSNAILTSGNARIIGISNGSVFC